MEAITLVNVPDVQTDRIIHHRKTNKPLKNENIKLDGGHHTSKRTGRTDRQDYSP